MGYGGLVNGYLVETNVAIIVAKAPKQSIPYIKLLPKGVKYLVMRPEELNDKTLKLVEQLV
jgi:hypothetical protein